MTSADLLALVVAQLRGDGGDANPPQFPTDAGARVYSPGDWPTQQQQYPLLKVRIAREHKQSLGRGGGPQFTVTATIRIIGEVSAQVEVKDAGAEAAQAALWALHRQVEVAVIGSYPLEQQIQQIASIDAQLSFNSDAETHLAGIQIDLALEFYQGPEDFAPIESEPLEEIHVEDTNHPPVGFTVDLPQ